jgi:hypothetical protein
MPDYSKALIYKLVCNDTYITENYIGSCCDYDERKRNHKSDCNNINGKKYNIYKYKFIRENGGFENWSMIIIKQFPCNSKSELVCEETVQMDLLGGELNTIRPFVTDEERQERNKEYIKEYNEKNKEERNEYNKQYREKNKEKIKELDRLYKEKNKEQLKEYKKEYREKNKEEIKERERIYRENNKEKIKEYKNQKVECTCGGRYTNSSKSKHFKTKKHINHINNSKDTS